MSIISENGSGSCMGFEQYSSKLILRVLDIVNSMYFGQVRLCLGSLWS